MTLSKKTDLPDARQQHALPSFRAGCCILILAFITGLLVASGTLLAWYHWIAGGGHDYLTRCSVRHDGCSVHP
ncbi:hypothetical protein AC152_25145 [Salmonella enterica]|nr:hypothetical protein [Salmonella enterica]EAY7468850.1 hypothetical protein [Salmonella enterica]EDG9409688.1 hypothetical protein [Salmonella enterica subsp. enterica serovar Tennessee]HAE4724870.1 hypothetical protein [Salmonella enterica subsp. salamae serovar 47:a:1,5]